jgi:hypothetical protein
VFAGTGSRADRGTACDARDRPAVEAEVAPVGRGADAAGAVPEDVRDGLVDPGLTGVTAPETDAGRAAPTALHDGDGEAISVGDVSSGAA